MEQGSFQWNPTRKPCGDGSRVPCVRCLEPPSPLVCSAFFNWTLGAAWVCSRLLLFPLFQLALHEDWLFLLLVFVDHEGVCESERLVPSILNVQLWLSDASWEELQLWHVAYGGSLLWIADCILQAGLVFYCTKNRLKLFFAIPNTLSSFEPLLLSGDGALLSASWPWFVLCKSLPMVEIMLLLFQKYEDNVCGNLGHIWAYHCYTWWTLRNDARKTFAIIRCQVPC